MKNFRILHISDIHIGGTYTKSEDIAYRLIEDIENEQINDVKAVVVTGDIFDGKLGYKERLVDEAVNFFSIIYNQIKSINSQIEKEDILFVPGNHDIIRSDDEDEKWHKYKTFLKNFYGKIPNFYNTSNYTFVKAYENERIVFAGFNSCGLTKEPFIESTTIENIEKINEESFDNASIDKEKIISFLKKQQSNQYYVDYGEITPKQLLDVKRRLDIYSDFNIVALMHHHFYLFPEIVTRFGDSSLIRNYTAVIQQMQQIGVKTVLHGHKHFDLESPIITDSYYNDENSIINVIAGGSIGKEKINNHSFNVIDFFDKNDSKKLLQRKFVYNNAQLKPIVVKQIPPKDNKKNSIINLLSTFEYNDYDLYCKYMDAIEKINVVADDYDNMNKWLENIFSGFTNVLKLLDKDSLCIFFLLYSMNYRILKIKQKIGNEAIDKSYFNILDELISSEKNDIDFNLNEFIKLFEIEDLIVVKEKCDNILDELKSKKSKNYLAFTMIGIFISDLYLMLRYYADDFYKKHIKYKVNINLNENEFHQNVPVNKIMIHSDADRRSVYIDLRCYSATSHKIAVLFIKEFELIISKYEDYFKIIDLKLYYLTPKIDNGGAKNTIENYNFEAYIPTLIPLLTGDNIYEKKEVFARELIQNSIDAIAVREAQGDSFDKNIYITLGRKNNKTYFKIKDFGTGMDQFKIERYFTSIGRSFYSGDEYRDLELDYKPISNFGIGFLSAFMICREIDVRTKYFESESQGIRLHIPNYDGCFFIEKDDSAEVGTEITLYIDAKISNNIKPQSIVNYICDVMKDIKYNIVIDDKIDCFESTIYSNAYRKDIDNHNILFVPFTDDGKIVDTINVYNDIWTNKYLKKYQYGLLVKFPSKNDCMGHVLNSGILLSDISIRDIWSLLLNEDVDKNYSNISDSFVFNFPSNYLNIDVSREKVTELYKNVVDKNFSINLLNEIYKQICIYLDFSKKSDLKINANSIYMLINYMKILCSIGKFEELKNKFNSIQYVPCIIFDKDKIKVSICHSNRKEKNAIIFNYKNYKIINDKLLYFISKNIGSDVYKEIFSFKKPDHILSLFSSTKLPHLFEQRYYSGVYSSELEYRTQEAKRICEKLLGKTYSDSKSYFFFLLSSLYYEFYKGTHETNIPTSFYFFYHMLYKYNITEIENSKCIAIIEIGDVNEVLNALNDYLK